MKDPSNSPQNVQHTAADTRRLHFWVPNLSRFLGMAILAATVAWIVVLLADVRQPWIHPELVEVPPLLWSRLPHTFVGQLRGIFEWSWFEPNPSRFRLVSDLFQVLDAMVFPLVGRVFTITSLGNVTTMLLFTLTPWFFFRTLRIWSFNPDFASLVEADRYHVFITPYGESNGLFVSNRGESGFQVREQQGGMSNV